LNGKFLTRSGVKRQHLVWGDLAWHSLPRSTRARQLAVAEVTLEPGFAHNFHKHPRQEEVIYVIAGEIEQWLGKRRRVLRAGESVFIPKNTVHASFNASKRSALLLAALGPCAGKEGYELIDVSGRAPWKSLRR